MNANQLAQAEDALAARDPLLGKLIQRQRPVNFESRGDYFFSLTRSIIGQQVSVAAAAAIFGRLQAATSLDPGAVAALSSVELRAIGLSRQKVAYVQDLAAHFAENPQIYDNLELLPDDQVISELTKVKGVGVWTAELFLMFNLARLDVFAPDDIGLQRAMKLLYGWEQILPKAKLIQFADRWRPYRTVASWHLWKSLHNNPA